MRGPIGAQDQLKARGEIEVESPQRHRIEIADRRFGESLHGLLRRSRGNQRSSSCRMQQALRAQVVGIRVAGALARQHPHAAARTRPLAGRLDDLFVHAKGRRCYGLEIKIGVVASSGERFAQAALQQPFGDAELLKKVTSVAGRGGSGGIRHCSFSLRFFGIRPTRKKHVGLVVRTHQNRPRSTGAHAKFVP